MNDVLKPDAVAQQATKTKPDWRTKDARAARRAKTATVPSVTCGGQPSPSAFIEQLWVHPKVAAAANAVARAQAVRNSVARKLDGGSLAVTADDLTRLDGALTEAKLRLGELSPEHPDALIPALS